MLARVSSRRWLRRFAELYIGLFQGTPLLMQLFLVFFGLPLIGMRIEPWSAAVVGLTLCASAFLAEIWRGGVEAIPLGQWDAAKSVGLHYVERDAPRDPAAGLRDHARADGRLPGATREETAVTSIIGFEELMRASNAINNATFEPFTVYGLVALIYFAMCFPLTRYARHLQLRMRS